MSGAPKLDKVEVSVSLSQRELNIFEEFDAGLPLLESLPFEDNETSSSVGSSTLAVVTTFLPSDGVTFDLLSVSFCYE